jgi:hypothetical protein
MTGGRVPGGNSIFASPRDNETLVKHKSSYRPGLSEKAFDPSLLRVNPYTEVADHFAGMEQVQRPCMRKSSGGSGDFMAAVNN